MLCTLQIEGLPCREQLNKVQAELTYTSNKCSALSQENELLRGQPRSHACPAEEADPLAEQVGSRRAMQCYIDVQRLIFHAVQPVSRGKSI